MILDLIVIETGDGFTAEIPSLNGCECWAHNEEAVITKVVEMLRFYVSLDDETEIKIDQARKSKNKKTFKLVFNKS